MEMNGSTGILAVQLNIEQYLKQNYHGKIHAMKWQLLEAGRKRFL
jgi:hypothetical protein